MHREIDALLAAYTAEQRREAKLIEEMLTALAANADARNRMVTSLARAVVGGLPSGSAEVATDDISSAVVELRQARAGAR